MKTLFTGCRFKCAGTRVGLTFVFRIEFLEKEGSPGSVIDRCVVSNSRTVSEHKFSGFRIEM